MKQITLTLSAPVRAQAEQAALPLSHAFRASGWELAESIWMSATPFAPLALRGHATPIRDGALRIIFVHDRNDAVAPALYRPTAPVARR
jgi:hypothetical protein